LNQEGVAFDVLTQDIQADAVEGKRGAAHQEKLRICDIEGKRGKKGKVLDISGRLKTLSAASE